MKNQAKQKAANDQKELGNRINIPALTMQYELFNQVEEDSFIPLFKPGKTGEEFLIDLNGKLSILTKSLNAVPSFFNQS